MEIGTALLIGMFVNLFGLALYFELRDRSFFKRENFKIQKSNVLAQNKLNIEKMRKEMGLPSKASKTSQDATQGLIGDVIKNYISKDDEGGGGGLKAIAGDFIANFVENNPEVVEGLIKGLTEKPEETGIKIYEP